MMALAGSTVGDQPEIVPCSVSNRNTLWPVTLFLVTANPGPSLLVKTVPVGAPGTVTVSGILAKLGDP